MRQDQFCLEYVLPNPAPQFPTFFQSWAEEEIRENAN